MQAVRRAGPDDLAAIVALAHRQRTETAGQRGGALWARDDARPEPLEAAYSALVGSEDALIVVATSNESVVGFGAAEIRLLPAGGTLGILTDLYVEPEARRGGVGEGVLAMLADFCCGRDCVGIDALALPGQRAAKSFFEKMGFTARLLVMHRESGHETEDTG